MTQARLRNVLALLLLGILTTAPVHAGDPTQSFRAGVEASRQGQHNQALFYFETARASGLDTPQLHYNLGVTYRRLNQLAQARQAFTLAAHHSDLASPAHYQLGLIARDLGDRNEARRQFRLAEATATTARFKRASQAQLAALSEGSAITPSPRGYGFFTAEAGYDSNVASADDSATSSSDGDFFIDLLGWGEYRLTSATEPDLRASGMLNTRLYSDLSEADLMILQGGLRWYPDQPSWRPRLGVQLAHVRLDGDAMESAATLLAGTRRNAGPLGELRLGARASQISGGNNFGYLDGSRYELNIGLHSRQQAINWFVRYDVSVENRDDITRTNNTFQSVSPTRQGVTTGISPILGDPIRLDLSVQYRVSRYADPDQLEGGDLLRREDKLLRLNGIVSYPLGTAWQGTARASWSDNRSNLNAYGYRRLELAAGIERSF